MSTGAEMETLSAATRRLQAAGYTGHWYVGDEEGLVCTDCGRTLAPDEALVDEVVRFEGPSDPGDESVLFALRTGDGHKGLYSVTYGPYTPSADAAVVRTLHTTST